MKKGVATTILFFVVAVLIIGIVIFSPKLRSSDTSLSEVIGGIRISKCTDSDGINYYSKDTCTGTNGNYADSCQGSYLREYYCSGSRCLARSVSCPSGYICSNGACVASSIQLVDLFCASNGIVNFAIKNIGTNNISLARCSPCFPAGSAIAYVDHNVNSLVIRVGPSAISTISATVGATSTPVLAGPFTSGTDVTLTLVDLFAGDPYVTVQYTDTASGLVHYMIVRLHESITCTQTSPSGDTCILGGGTFPLGPGQVTTAQDTCTGTGGRLCVYKLIPSVGPTVNASAYCT